MIAVDTNILARYYVDDPADPEAARQRPIAESLMREGAGVLVTVTVVLEFAWVLRGFYGFEAEDSARAIEHLVGLPNVTVEDWSAILEAARLHRAGLDFADALHVSRAGQCERFYTFDDRKFARRAIKLGIVPAVQVP
ncbi:MAG TPA: type II toxin-antitoxin system VapC family toxin [Candidatus Accumulibacter phosphatis]|nr:type II toxin-antitoxin system VapC family toxin [Candidatus Accumulibacter phosphatis]HRQ95930.1 type II toxin-antitoxin system VapC family toxin [Candidatus Accumulibacter phosphatis]